MQTELNFPQTLPFSKSLSGRLFTFQLTVVKPDRLIASGSGDQIKLGELHIAGDVDPAAGRPLVSEVRGGVTD